MTLFNNKMESLGVQVQTNLAREYFDTTQSPITLATQVDKCTYFLPVAEVTLSATAHRAYHSDLTQPLDFNLKRGRGPMDDHQKVAAEVNTQNLGHFASHCTLTEAERPEHTTT